ncbi:hypothetical protein, partial [Candidatus Bathycorpusculum sp.]|uniref:hypothetical protein n=1 Tax=Candidatus Bathycorpusculum sp. TaxID=2994959 RepID=UPI0028305F5C|nr:hypothetical protein [Candidatus Termitimicrobium sp.]
MIFEISLQTLISISTPETCGEKIYMKRCYKKSLISLLVLSLFVSYMAILPQTQSAPADVTSPQMFELWGSELTVTKTVNGQPFANWLESFNGDVNELIAGMTFEVYDVTVYGGSSIAVGTIDPVTGIITFDPAVTEAGTYDIVEKFTTATAQNTFEQEVSICVHFVGDFTNAANDFDEDALYIIVNGYDGGVAGPDSRFIKNLQYGQNGDYLDANGNIFYIGVKNDDTGVVYTSFCAHAGSERFAGDNGLDCSGYMVGVPADEIGDITEFLAAFNYIEDNYNVDAATKRVITQTVIWVLLGAIDVDSELFADANLTDVERAAVLDVLTAVEDGYTGEGRIVKLVYMICEKHGTTEEGLSKCQPQLVPLYADPTIPVIDNTYIPASGFSLIKTINGLEFTMWLKGYSGNVDELLADISFNLYKVDADGADYIGNPVVAIGTLYANGSIIFDNLPKETGWYAVVEVLSGKAAKIFEDVTSPLYIYIYENGVTSADSVPPMGTIFRLESSIVSNSGVTYYSGANKVPSTILDIWNLENADTNVIIGDAYCADMTIFSHGNTYYVQGDFLSRYSNAVQDRIVFALNYIDAEYNLATDEGRVLAQLVISTIINDGIFAGLPNGNYFDSIEFSSAFSATYPNINWQLIVDISNGAVSSNVDNDREIFGFLWLVGYEQPANAAQPLIVPLFKAEPPPFDNEAKPGVFAILKMYEEYNSGKRECEYLPADGTHVFTFNAYTVVLDATGNKIKGDLILANVQTNADGLAIFRDNAIIVGDEYWIEEALPSGGYPGLRLSDKNAEGYLIVTAVDEDEFSRMIIFDTFYNDLVPTGRLEITKKANDYIMYKGVNGLTVELTDITDGAKWTFDIIKGNQVYSGPWTITYNGNNQFTVTFSMAMLPHSATLTITDANDVSQVFTFNENEVPFTFTTTVDLTQAVTVSLDADYFLSYENIDGLFAGATFDVVITGPSYPNGETIKVVINGPTVLLDGLKPGVYTVEEINNDGWSVSYVVNGASVAIVDPNNGVTVEVLNVTEENPTLTSTVKITNTYIVEVPPTDDDDETVVPPTDDDDETVVPPTDDDDETVVPPTDDDD